jgi:hypothetical protein
MSGRQFSFSPFTGRRWPKGPDEGQRELGHAGAAPHLPAGILSPQAGGGAL